MTSLFVRRSASRRDAWREGFDLAVNMMEIAAEFKHGGAKTIGGGALVHAARAIARNRDDAEQQAARHGLFDGDAQRAYFVAYEDDGPTDLPNPNADPEPWKRLYVFGAPKAMLDFVHDVGVEPYRRNARVVGFWAADDDHYPPVHDTTEAAAS